MKERETLECYIRYFQSKMAMVYNCSDDVVTAAFIVGLQTDHSSYKHLEMHDVTNMKGIMSQAQKYIQLEETTRSTTNHSTRYEAEASHKTQGHSRGHDAHKLVHPNPSQSQLRVFRTDADFTPLKLPIEQVFRAIEGQPWVNA